MGRGLDDRAEDHDGSADEDGEAPSNAINEVGRDGVGSETADGLDAVKQSQLMVEEEVRNQGSEVAWRRSGGRFGAKLRSTSQGEFLRGRRRVTNHSTSGVVESRVPLLECLETVHHGSYRGTRKMQQGQPEVSRHQRRTPTIVTVGGRRDE